MSVWVRGGTVKVGGQAQNAGFHFGQNIQDGWDSMSTEKMAIGRNMGDFSAMTTGWSQYTGVSITWQPVSDSDWKGNFNHARMR